MAKYFTKWPKIIPNSRKIDQVASIARPFKIYPTRDFWFEKNVIWQPSNQCLATFGFLRPIRIQLLLYFFQS
jgi:hypothetical protein